ncbi:hypothetical protein OSG_eHP29_00130 [environmental Halophage eHP-29]|nr:hypothetical protein OSG_eHP29_00130 [environmental Halophage eHP-29]
MRNEQTQATSETTRELLLTNQMLLRAILGRLSMATATESDDETPVYECLVCQKEYYQMNSKIMQVIVLAIIQRWVRMY